MQPCIAPLIVVELSMAKQFCVALIVSCALLTPLKAAPLPCFVVGPVTFSNCQVSNSTSPPGLPPMTFSLVPVSFNVPPGSLNTNLLIPGSYFLSSGNVPQAVSETLSADFSMQGYTLLFLTAFGVAEDTANFDTVSENIFFTSPCSAGIGGGGGRNTACTPRSGMQSGSLVVQLEIHSTSCPDGPGCDAGRVGPVDIALVLQAVPESSAFLLMPLGVIGVGLVSLWRSRRLTPR
jgi:hypothetical protein